jgi:uncharacterized protein YfkK (UPF0435 family)
MEKKEVRQILKQLESKKLDFKKSEEFVKNLISILGEDKQLSEVLNVLNQCVLEKEDQKLEKYYQLRDHLLIKLIDDLIKLKLIKQDDYTFNVLGKLNVDELNDLMLEYNSSLYSIMKYWKWKNVGALFSYDKEAFDELIEYYGEDYKAYYDTCDDEEAKGRLTSEEIAKDSLNTELLCKFINDATEKWGDTSLTDVKNELKSIKTKDLPTLSNIRFEWHYCTRCDDYDNYDSCGNFCDILEKIYKEENELVYNSVELLYKRAESPMDLNKWEYEYSNVRRTSELPSIEIFLLLIWADVERCQNIR